MQTRELQGRAFRCLEGCGFCCTFTPEVAHDELARLRRRFPALPVARSDGHMRLAFQGGCGACTLLQRRQCTAYEDRPAHCRYFPFHVYFGRRTEVYLNASCRGVEPAPGGDLASAFEAQVLSVARPHNLAEQARTAAKVHKEFEANARSAGAWTDLDAAIAAAIADPGLWDSAAEPDAWSQALAPFAADDPVNRPYWLRPDLRWTTFETQPNGHLVPLHMEEDGSLAADGAPMAVPPALPDNAIRAGLADYLHRLTQRDLFAGTVCEAVDADGYAWGVAAAASDQARRVAADLLVRAELLRILGVPADHIAAETERFYDAAFLDLPTIGGWL